MLINIFDFTNVPCINGNGRNLYFAKYNWFIRFFIGLTLVYIGGSIPMNAFLVKGYFDTIPKELDESAKIDGAGHMCIFLQIMLPLAKPILAVVALFNFMGPFMDFILPKILLRSPEKFTLAVGLFSFINDKY
ncbi:ABC transporter permease subunit [Staphylococcus aureus]